ncbi:MAG: redoxin domain-containing protein, partial [Chitinophagaceae bacterium]
MNKLLLSLTVVLIASLAFGQSVKKMNISDLEAYIKQSEKPLVVNFWATFCKPCIEEIPYFQNTIKEKYDGLVDLVLVSLDLPEYFPYRLSYFGTQKNISVPIVWLNETNADYFCPKIDMKWSGAIPA